MALLESPHPSLPCRTPQAIVEPVSSFSNPFRCLRTCSPSSKPSSHCLTHLAIAKPSRRCQARVFDGRHAVRWGREGHPLRWLTVAVGGYPSNPHCRVDSPFSAIVDSRVVVPRTPRYTSIEVGVVSSSRHCSVALVICYAKSCYRNPRAKRNSPHPSGKGGGAGVAVLHLLGRW